MSGEGASERSYPIETMLDALHVLKNYDVALLAVSGGGDSTALMHLALTWQHEQATPQPVFVVATVDHGLRPGSAEEAAVVARAAEAAGFQHHILTIADKPDGEFSQAWARGARYRALTGLARSLDARRIAIVTAHTCDDQAETVLMRLARGSGIDGLGGMRPVTTIANYGDRQIDLVRPLLNVPRAALASMLRSQKLDWIEDPSNELERFERVRIRGARAARDALGLDDEKLALTAKRAQRASAALESVLLREVRTAGRLLELSPLGYADADVRWLLQFDEELRLRLFARLIASVGGQDGPVPLGSLEDRLEAWQAGSETGRGFTLHGGLVETRNNRVLVMREPPDARTSRELLPVRLGALPLTGHTETRWDNRFILTCPDRIGGGVTVGPLGADGVAELERSGWSRPPRVPIPVLRGQPAIRALNSVLWAPTIDYRRAGEAACPIVIAFDWSTFGNDRGLTF